MKILIISQYYPPEIGAAATRWSEYAQILMEMGHAVTIVSELPNYPTGKIAAGYPKFWFHEEARTPGQPRVLRVPVWANPRKSTLQRLGFFTTFMISATLRSYFLPRFDLIIYSSPPLFVGLVAAFLRPFKRGRYILDLRDIWPESAYVLGEIRSRRMLQFGRFLERMVYASMDAFLLAVPGFKSYLDKHHAHHHNKLKLDLMNGVSQSFIKSFPDQPTRSDTAPFTVLFSGNIGLAQGLDTVLDAAEKLKAEDIYFKIIGDGAKKAELEQAAREKRLDKVSFIPSMPRSDLVHQIAESDLCLVPLIKSPLFLNAIPSKMLEYMAAGKPVIVSIQGEVESLVSRSGGGVCIPPEDALTLVKTILEYRDNPGRCLAEGQSAAQFVAGALTKEGMMTLVMEQLTSHM